MRRGHESAHSNAMSTDQPPRILTPHPGPAVRQAALDLIETGNVPTETYDSTYGCANSD